MGRNPEAEAALLEAYESHRTGLGEKHARTLRVISDLADFHDDGGRQAEAARWRAKLP